MPKKWKPLKIEGKSYDLSHLNAYSFVTLISDKSITINIEFHSHHVFTDDKEKGAEIRFNNETRYFCLTRYNDSKALKSFFCESLLEEYVKVYYSESSENVYYRNYLDYIVFMSIRRTNDTTIKIIVISAYTIEQWGAETIPNGETFRFRYVLSQKLAKQNILKPKKKRR